MYKTLCVILFISCVFCDNFSNINLPEEHLPFYFTNFPKIAEKCRKDEKCPFKEHTNKNKCWGYEYECKAKEQFAQPDCPGDHKGWVKTKEDQIKTFFTEADFGFIKQQLKELMVLCEPIFADDSSLECSEHLKFCRGRNIMVNFTSLLSREEPLRYKMDVLNEGDIGGYCEVRNDLLEKNADQISPLQSWGPEMRYFTRLSRRPIIEGDCDIVIEKPTYIMKIDATVNMYHHFCDFVNLYMSQHLNATSPDAFSTDSHVLIWETYTYRSLFEDAFKAFTDHPIWDLKTFRGKVVCFKNVVFPLLPRMIFGLYYNTPIIYGCQNSGLFKAFSEHMLHRLRIPFQERNNPKIRVTFLSRDTKYRRIQNEDELISALERNRGFDVQRIVYNKDIPFKKQLEISRNSDILIGMHGAGLTHLLFLPDWAAIFELYNCDDANCYKDLTRLRGLKYVTWKDNSKLVQHDTDGHPDIANHAKFANYSFDVDEFLKLVKLAANHVKNHPKFKDLIKEFNNVHSEL